MDVGTTGIRPARPGDAAPAQALLRETGLPLDGFADHIADALVAEREARLVGVVELELHEGAALLRSLAVEPAERGRGTGERLVSEAMALAARRGIRDVYLLTETAARFFPRFGFVVASREDAPDAIRSSVEFRVACAVSAVLMHARTEGGRT